MAIYHFSCTTISRGKGQSAIASAAYRSGERLYSERYGETKFYARETQPETFILKPDHAPEWCLNREYLWNGVEEVEKANNSQLAREINIALPIELSKEEQLALTKEYVQKNFVDEGMVADVFIHRDNENNPHFHVMLTMRPFDKNGNWRSKSKRIILKDEEGNTLYYPSGDKKSRKQRTTDWDSKDKLNLWRKNWADITNKYLERNGFSERISEKSHAELGIEKEPTIHEGYVARQMEKEGKISDRCQQNRERTKRNYDKQSERKEYVEKEAKKSISSGLAPKEKQQLKSVAKNLKIYVSYDNLMDKQRMVNNWERAVNVNSQIQPDQNFNDTFNKIKEARESISMGKDILEKQFTRIYEKYYPELNEKYTYSTYYKMAIAEETLKQDRVLSAQEIGQVLSEAQDNELNYMLTTIMKNPYVQPVHEYQKKLFHVTNELNGFLDERGITKELISQLSVDDQKVYRQLYNTQNIQVRSLEILEKYFDNTICSYFPNANTTELSIKQKEALSQTIDYYGNRMSYEKLVDLANEKAVNKYSTTEQKIGLSFIYKLETNSFTEEEWNKIEKDYELKEIYDTISDPKMRGYFLNEVKENGLDVPQEYMTQSNGFLMSFLANNLNVFNNLINANEQNKRRELEDLRNKRKSKKQNSRKQKSKKSKQKEQTTNI